MTEKISKLGPIPRRQKMLKIFNYLGEIFSRPKTNEEQPNITDIPELESEEFAAQKRKQKGKGLKILIPSQMFSKLPISLAQLKAENN